MRSQRVNERMDDSGEKQPISVERVSVYANVGRYATKDRDTRTQREANVARYRKVDDKEANVDGHTVIFGQR